MNENVDINISAHDAVLEEPLSEYAQNRQIVKPNNSNVLGTIKPKSLSSALQRSCHQQRRTISFFFYKSGVYGQYIGIRTIHSLNDTVSCKT